MNSTFCGKHTPDAELEDSVSTRVPHNYFLRISVFFIISITLGSCRNPTTSTVTLTSSTATLAATATAADATQTRSPQIPPPSIANVIPRPVSVVAAGGTFILSSEATIFVEPDTQVVTAIGLYLADSLNPATGYSLKVQ